SALDRGAPVPHSDVVSALDRAEQRHAGQPARARVRLGGEPGLDLSAGGTRPDVDRIDRGLGGLCGASVARSAAMIELSPYLVLLLVGFLPNEIWRVLGVWVGGGLPENSEFVVWVRAVAVAVLAAVVAKLTLVPPC